MTDPILSVPPGGALSVRDFCRWSSLGRTAVYEEIGRGRLKARKVGRRTIILFEDARRWLDTLPTHEEALDAADTRRRAASGSRRGRGYDRPSGGNSQNVMGASLPSLSRKRKKRNPEKEKPCSKNKKDTAEKKPPALATPR